MTEIHGIRYDGARAEGEPVALSLDGDDVALMTPAGTQRLARAAIVPEMAVLGVSRRLRLPDGSVIETEGQVVDAWWPASRGIDRWALAIESRWPLVILLASIAALLTWIVITHALPLAAKPVSQLVSPEAERFIGMQALSTLDRLFAKESNLTEDEREHVTALLDDLTRGESESINVRLEFRHLGMPNAFALPGNIIVVSDELVHFVGGDDELLAVLAHELGHLHGHHAVRLVLQQSGVAVLATALAGDAVAMTFLAAGLPSALVNARYSRALESEADDYAIAQLERHGRSPGVFAQVMRRFAEKMARADSNDPLIRYLSSHPPTEERIGRAEDAARNRR